MMRQVKESDWKLLRQLAPVALERCCSRILAEINVLPADTTKNCHQRYLTIYHLVENRDEEIAKTFNDLRRSSAFIQLALMRTHGPVQDDEFSRFSEETRAAVELLTPR
jgi:hypothetical protein